MGERRSDAAQDQGYALSEISTRLGSRIDTVIGRLGLDGERWGGHFVAHNPNRADKKLGSFRIDLGGAEPGRWFDHAMPAIGGKGKCLGGDVLDLVAYCAYGDINGTTRGKAKGWALDFLGLSDAGRPTRSAAELEADAKRLAEQKRAREARDERKRQERVNAGRHIWLTANKELLGTAADEYLQGRGIELAGMAAKFGKLPGALRFKPKLWHAPSQRTYPALVSAISGPNGLNNVQGCHRAWIDRDAAGRWIKAPIDDARMTLGIKKGGYIPIWRGAAGKALKNAPEGTTIVVAEGVEDALSNAIASPEWMHIASIDLGNMACLDFPETIRTVIISGENDTSQSAIDMRNAAARRWLDEGREVRLALPVVGKDANDLMRGVS